MTLKSDKFILVVASVDVLDLVLGFPFVHLVHMRSTYFGFDDLFQARLIVVVILQH